MFHRLVLIGLILAPLGVISPRGAASAPQEQGTLPPPPAEVLAPIEAEQGQPTFRAGINFVRVDVIVSGRDGKPVTDLAARDFEVFEDDVPQQIQSFKLVEARTTAASGEAPRQIRSASDEEVEAARDDTRIVAIFLDDYHVRETNSLRVRQELVAFIENELLPSDLLMVMSPLTPLSELRLTRDHRQIASAVAGFRGVKYDYRPRNAFEERYAMYSANVVERVRNQVTMSALKGLAVRLGSLREGRKAVLLVSEGFMARLPPQLADPVASLPGVGNPSRLDPTAGGGGQSSAELFDQADVLQDLREVYDAANRHNTAIYALDPRGLAAQEFGIDENVNSTADRNLLSQTTDSLRALSENTDGRAIVASNDLRRGLAQMLSDTATYYLLGYSSSQVPQDGRFHEIDVRVKRPRLQVRARRGYWALTSGEAAAALAPPRPGLSPAVEAALGALATVTRGRVIRTWIGTAPGGDGKTRVTLVWEPAPPSSGRREEPARVRVLATGGGGDPYFRGAVPADPAPPAGGVAVRGPWQVGFDAVPGRLDLTLTVEGSAAEVLDKDQIEIDVPDLTGPDVRLSTPQLFRARTAREWQALAADAGATPSVGREFSRTERLLVRVAVLGAAAPPPAARVLNRGGDRMVDLAPQPAAIGGAWWHVDVPLASLPAGEYLIELAAADARELVAIRVGG